MILKINKSPYQTEGRLIVKKVQILEMMSLQFDANTCSLSYNALFPSCKAKLDLANGCSWGVINCRKYKKTPSNSGE